MAELPELNSDQILFLQTIFNVFHVKGKWPTYADVDRIITHKHPNFNMEAISKSMHDGFASNFGFQPQYDQEAFFIVLALHYCQGAEEEIADFIHVVHHCVKRYDRYYSFGEETPEKDALEFSSEHLSNHLHMEPLTIRKMGLLLYHEYDIVFGFSSADTEYNSWHFPLKRGTDGVSRYRGIETFEQYIEKRSPLVPPNYTSRYPLGLVQDNPVSDMTVMGLRRVSTQVQVHGDQYNILGNSGEVKIKSPLKEQPMSKIKVLFLAANPTSTISLRLDEEMWAITEKIRISEHRDLIDVVSAWAVRPDDLLQAFNLHKPQIVHFSGHGNRAGEIILVDNTGTTKSVATKALKALFTTLKDNIQVVILNACYSGTQAAAIIEVINCAIGMNDSIGDQAAIIFASSFYRALGFGRSVQEAFDQGKVALLLEGISEENTPELLVKEGIDPSQIVLVSQTNPSLVSSLSSSALSSKMMKRERLFNAYKVILNAADTYQVEAQQMNHIASPANISLTGVDEAVNEISLEDVDTEVLSIFFDLRGAFHVFAARLNMPEEGLWEDVLKHKYKVSEKFEELKTTMKKHLKELES